MANNSVTIQKADTISNIPEDDLHAADVGLSLVEHSSPLARRVSQVLINDLADLLTLVESARRLKPQEADVFFLRLAAVLALFLGLYSWMLTWLFLF